MKHEGHGNTEAHGRNVEPLLTPRLTSAHRLEYAPRRALAFTLEGRYQSRASLDDTSSPDRSLPDFYMLDATARATGSRATLTVRGGNLGYAQSSVADR